MKIKGFIFTTIIGAASAGIPIPEITIGLNAGEETSSSNLGGLEPNVKWQAGGSAIGLDVEGGFDMDITSTNEAPAPSIWGKFKKSFSDSADVSIRGDMNTAALDSIGLDIQANSFGTSFQMIGRLDTKAKRTEISKVQLSKDIFTPVGILSLNPLFDVPSKSGDIRFGFSLDNTSFQVHTGQQRLTVSHSFSESETITPSVSADGDFNLSYSRGLSKGTLNTSYAPNDSIKVQWADGEWQTTFKAPLEGYYNTNGGIKVNMKRSVGMF